jgi:hypothetical protein
VAAEEHRPLELSDVLSYPSPTALYAEKYGAFQFSSQSRLSLGGEGGEPLEGKSFLERDERGNYHLVRVPLSPDPLVEVFYTDGKVLLRIGKDNNFFPVRHQVEFDRWATRSLREVFTLYENSFLSDAKASTSREKLTCWSTKNARICTDPTTGLPLEGQFRPMVPDPRSVKASSAPEVRFSISPADPEKFSITAPDRSKISSR